MATMEEFKELLKEVVKGKRLSASRMEKITEVSMKLMENDTQLVSILYRTHKSLRANAKISSLYIFDALCRAARHQVVKRNLTGDINAENGNCATFLLRMEGVLDGLFQDVLSSGIPEAKEKTKKILDIWTKANTFPANVLTRLGEVQGRVVESPDAKETKHAASDTPTPTSDPRKHPTPPIEITPPPVNPTHTGAEAAQAALFALLTSAVATKPLLNNNQTPVNTANVPAFPQPQTQTQLEQLQFALQQQLSRNNNGNLVVSSGSAQPRAPPIPPHLMTSTSTSPHPLNQFGHKMNFPGSSSMSPVNSGPYPYPGPERRDPRQNRFSDTHSDRGREGNYYDDRRRSDNVRGARGAFRGAGRGDYRGASQQENNSWDRSEQFSGGPPPNRRRLNSRSQSPPPRRDNKSSYSPPRRPSVTTMGESSRVPLSDAPGIGLDEFGREIRPSSEEPEGSQREEASNKRESHSTEPESDFSSDYKSAAPHETKMGSTGLESFDISTFDPTSAESWTALGNAFQVTNGYVPSQEELMQLVMANMGIAMGVGIGAGPGVPNPSASFGNAGGPLSNKVIDQGWGVGFGEVGHNKRAYIQGSDAVVLGPSTDDSPNATEISREIPSANADVPPIGTRGDGGPGGQMRKVDDRWVFVRDEV